MKIAIIQTGNFEYSLLRNLFPNATLVHVDKIEEQTESFDVAFYHIDLTYIPPSDQINSKLCINQNLRNISKKQLHFLCEKAGIPSLKAIKEGDENEKMIVKTTINCGAQETGVKDANYPILLRKEVSNELWEDPKHVVEKFVENSRGIFYRAYFLLDKLCVLKVWHDSPLKKVISGRKWQGFLKGNPEVQKIFDFTEPIRKLSNMEFGCMDFVEDEDGNPYVCDFGGCPFWGPIATLPIEGEINGQGILDHLRGAIILP